MMRQELYFKMISIHRLIQCLYLRKEKTKCLLGVFVKILIIQ